MNKYMYKEIDSCIGGGEEAELNLVTDMDSGESFIKLKMSYSKIYKTNELEKAQQDMKALTGSGYITDIERLVKLRNIDVANEHLYENPELLK